MIKNIGIDLVDSTRIKDIYNRYKNVFAAKILSKKEMFEFNKSTSKINFLSKRFASKEALSKALGTGLYRKGLYPSCITVIHDINGKPEFLFDSYLEIKLKNIDAKNIFLTISDTNSLTTAMVIIE